MRAKSRALGKQRTVKPALAAEDMGRKRTRPHHVLAAHASRNQRHPRWGRNEAEATAHRESLGGVAHGISDSLCATEGKEVHQVRKTSERRKGSAAQTDAARNGGNRSGVDEGA